MVLNHLYDGHWVFAGLWAGLALVLGTLEYGLSHRPSGRIAIAHAAALTATETTLRSIACGWNRLRGRRITTFTLWHNQDPDRGAGWQAHHRMSRVFTSEIPVSQDVLFQALDNLHARFSSVGPRENADLEVDLYQRASLRPLELCDVIELSGAPLPLENELVPAELWADSRRLWRRLSNGSWKPVFTTLAQDANEPLL
ncbi:hypothetical protein [Nonomuraea dietziae]|uniref:Uncharacterized protein n=1 Tax=Nonomuraea dietziae TaxID=65515 RepID=A0A7W5YE28_9ACTN|nr:hypothetical protein [Nonomuraea dietziae]MBB3734046.1 hypothetical protein [Nonomuraea dietziae]